jgi:hypothetical protein
VTAALSRTVRRGAAVVLVAGAVWWLWVLGRGDLAPPPVTSLDDLTAWFDARAPAVAVFAVLRLGCLGLAGYVFAVLVLGVVARAAGWSSMTRTADGALPPGLRRLAAWLFGMGLVGVATGPLADRGAGGTETMVVVDRLSPGEPSEVLVPLDDGNPAEGWATLSLLPSGKAAGESVASASPAPSAERWVVRRGDCLWSIAESHLGDVLGRPPSDAETTPYWRLVVEHNRPHLSNPHDPNLIFVGEVIELPPPGPAGARLLH